MSDLRWTLPQIAYTDTNVFAADLEHVFARHWTFAGHSCELDPGDWFRITLGRDQVIVVRDHDGTLHAHHDVCAHRGSRVTTAERGTAKAFVCPYHQWVYGLDGGLRSARLMGESFWDRYSTPIGGVRLAPVAVRETAGLVFVCLAATPDEAPEFDGFAHAAVRHLGPHGLEHARVVARDHYRVAANWKTLVENNRECYHCRGSHPEFSLSNFEQGTHGDVQPNPRYDTALAQARARWHDRGLATDEVSFPGGTWYRFTRLPLREGFTTETLDGRLVGRLMGTLPDEDVGSLRVVGLPNLWAHANADYAMTTRLTPVDAGTTDVEVCFLVHADARLDDADLDALTAVWRATSEQDWALCEATYAGVASRGYRPGPLSPVVEESVASFLDWYAARLPSVAPAAAG